MDNRVIHMQRLGIVTEETLLFSNVPLTECMTFEYVRHVAFRRNEDEAMQFLSSVIENGPEQMALEASIDLERAALWAAAIQELESGASS